MKSPILLIALSAVQAIAASTIFSDNFESGLLSPAWTISGSGTNRVRVLDSLSPDGNSEAILDDSVGDTNYSSSQLTFTSDLLGWSGLILQFDAKEFGDESHAPPIAPFSGDQGFDGVSIRVSPDTDEWYEVAGLRGLGDSYQTFSIDLDQTLADLGLVPTSTVQIRFNQYDNFPATSDGIAIDNILLTGAPPTPLHTWALSYNLGREDLPSTADPDRDGLTNLQEFAFDGDPLNGGSAGKVQLGTVLISGQPNPSDGKYLTYTFPVRNGAVFSLQPDEVSLAAIIDEVIYTIGATDDLDSYQLPVFEHTEVLDSGLPALNPGWSYRTFRLTESLDKKPSAFFRLGLEEISTGP